MINSTQAKLFKVVWKNQKNVDNDMQNIFIENPLSLGQLSHQLTHHHESHKHPYTLFCTLLMQYTL